MDKVFSVLHLGPAVAALLLASLGMSAATTPVGKVPLTVEATPREAGTVTGQGTYVAGTVVNVSATPMPHYRFVEWVGAKVTNPSSPLTRIYMESVPQRLVAVFEPELIELKARVEPANAGSVYGAGWRPYGGRIPLVAKPYAGFEFAGWEGPVENAQAPATRLAKPLGQGMAVTARFRPRVDKFQLTVLATPPAGGTVSGSGEFARGSVAPVRAIPAPGFVFNGWEGAVTSKGNLETTIFINDNETIKAQFLARNIWVEAIVSPAGSGRIEGDVGLQSWGKKCKIKALPESGYEFERWEGRGYSSSDAEVNFTPSDDGDILLKAHFRRINPN